MGLLDGELATSIYDGFKGRLLTGTIRQRTVPDSGALDANGDPVDLASTDVSLEGFFDNYDLAYMKRASLPDDSVKVCIFAKSCPDTTPTRDDIVRMRRAGIDYWFQLRRVMIDPAGALWECPDAFEIPAPEDA